MRPDSRLDFNGARPGFHACRIDFVFTEPFWVSRFIKPFFGAGTMQIHFTDFVTAANLLVLLGIYRKMSIIVYQHKLMWTDFAERKGISANGKHAASV
jgi:hypothetical protein